MLIYPSKLNGERYPTQASIMQLRKSGMRNRKRRFLQKSNTSFLLAIVFWERKKPERNVNNANIPSVIPLQKTCCSEPLT